MTKGTVVINISRKNIYGYQIENTVHSGIISSIHMHDTQTHLSKFWKFLLPRCTCPNSLKFVNVFFGFTNHTLTTSSHHFHKSSYYRYFILSLLMFIFYQELHSLLNIPYYHSLSACILKYLSNLQMFLSPVLFQNVIILLVVIFCMWKSSTLNIHDTHNVNSWHLWHHTLATISPSIHCNAFPVVPCTLPVFFIVNSLYYQFHHGILCCNWLKLLYVSPFAWFSVCLASSSIHSTICGMS